jgi:penicillin-binding protein 1A
MSLSKKILIILASFLGLCLVIFTAAYIALTKDLPNVSTLETYEPNLVSVVYDKDGKVIARYSTENRTVVTVETMPDLVKSAFIAAEDDEFFEHSGINPMTIIRAAIKNMRAGRTVQGGSTITQQVAKTFFLTPEKSIVRKVKEMFLAFEIENKFPKEKILNLYLNQIFLGQGAYGVEAAAKTYFGKTAQELTVPEVAILAGLPRAPSRDNPVVNPRGAKEKQRYVLRRLLEVKKITDTEYEEALNAPLNIRNSRFQVETEVPYFAEHVRRYLQKKYGSEALYTGGLKVYTTMDFEKQIAAQKSLDKGLENVDKRMGLRAPEIFLSREAERKDYVEKQHQKLVETHFDFKVLEGDGTLSLPLKEGEATPIKEGTIYDGLVIGKNEKSKAILIQVGNRKGEIAAKDYQWAQFANPEEIYAKRIIRSPFKELKTGHVIEVAPKKVTNDTVLFVLEQRPLVQGALLSFSLPDGAVLAMVGGYDFHSTKSEFNRATQAVRQPGSTFKPIVYGAALEQGLTPATIIVDSPLIYGSQDEQTELEKTWKPNNYGEKFYGDTRLRNALALSRNIPSIKVLQYLGVKTVIEFCRKLGITSKLNEDLSLALGSSGLTLEELMRAWAVYANEGKKLEPYFISKIEDRNAEILEEHQAPEVAQVLDEKIAFLMTSLLQSVVDFGTGADAQSLGRPIAAKTGTTNDSKDALFLGYIPQMLTGVWVGFDEDRPIGRNETGTVAALPIWLSYMKEATKELPVESFKVPSGIIQVAIDGETGNVPSERTRKRVTEYFIDGTAPGQRRVETNPAASPTGNVALNKTLVITGNNHLGQSTESSTSEGQEEDDSGSDDMLRDEY